MNGKYPIYTAFTEGSSVSLKINNVAKPEGNSGTSTMTFNVTLSAASQQTVTVNYKTKNNTAVAPSDFVAKTGTLTFAPGVKKQTIAIIINGDTQVESDEKFKVILSNAVNARIADSTGVGTIQNDDVAAATTAMTAKSANHDNAVILGPAEGRNTTSFLNHSPSAIFLTPNPATSRLRVQLHDFTGKIALRLTDLNGNTLRKAELQTNNFQLIQHELEVATLASGTYLLEVWDEKGNKRSEKVLIAH